MGESHKICQSRASLFQDLCTNLSFWGSFEEKNKILTTQGNSPSSKVKHVFHVDPATTPKKFTCYQNYGVVVVSEGLQTNWGQAVSQLFLDFRVQSLILKIL